MSFRMEKLDRCIMSNMKIILLITILLSAFLVRIWVANFGLPHVYNPDEGKIIYTAFYAASHGLRPDIYIHSILIAYILIPLYGIYFLMGTVLGQFPSTTEFYVAYHRDPTVFIILGRIFMIFASLGGILMIFLIGRRFFGEKVGILAAFFLSLSFLFVKESIYIKDEILASLFLTIFFYFVLSILEKKRLADFLGAGVFLGLSISAKYIYAPVFFLLPVVYFLRKEKKTRFFLSTSLTVAVFLLTNPYIIFDLSNFLDQTKGLFLTQRGIGSATMGGRSVWANFLGEHLPQGLGLPLFLVSVFGLAISSVGILGKKGLLLSAITFLVFVGILGGGGNFARWAVPMLPFLALSAAIFLEKVLGEKKAILVILASILVVSNFLRIVKFNYMLTASDTRTVAKLWIEENIPSGTKIAVDGTAREEMPSYLGPPLLLDEEGLVKKLADAQRKGEEGKSLQARLKVLNERVSYDLIGAPRLDFVFDEKTGIFRKIEDVSYYQEKEVDYLVTSAWVNRDGYGPEKNFLESFHQNYALVKEFAPRVIFENDPFWRVDYQALDKISIFEKGAVFGPTIKIYREK